MRYAICILTYTINKQGLHYSEEWAHQFLAAMRRDNKEVASVNTVYSGHPVICFYCGKQIGSNFAYATVMRPRFPSDCCYKRSRDNLIKRYDFTVFDFMPVVEMISHYMDVPASYVQHYATLEAMKYFARKEQKLNELSRYHTKPVIEFGFSHITSLS